MSVARRGLWRFSSRPAYVSLSSTVTSSPCSRTRWRTNVEPMNPAPPHTSSLMPASSQRAPRGSPRGRPATAGIGSTSSRSDSSADHAGTRRGARQLLAAWRPPRAQLDLRLAEDLAREVVPGDGARAGEVHDTADVALEQAEQRRREVARPRRAADLVDHHLDGVALAREPEHRLDEVAPVDPEQPRAAHDGVAGRGRQHLPLALELRRSVHRAGRGRVRLDVGARAVPSRRAAPRRRTRSRWRGAAAARPPPPRPRARMPAPTALTARACSAWASAPSTSVQAAQFTTASGAARDSAALHRRPRR